MKKTKILRTLCSLCMCYGLVFSAGRFSLLFFGEPKYPNQKTSENK